MTTLCFERVHEIGRHLLLERLGAERDPEALALATGELFDTLPEREQDAIWRALGRELAARNERDRFA